MQLRWALGIVVLVVALFAMAPRTDALTVTRSNYTANSSFTVTSHMTWVYVEAWGGGGAGGGKTGAGGAGGGAGGSYATYNFTTELAPGSYNVRIGAGGKGTTGNGPSGGTTHFGNGTHLAAKGGAGGLSAGTGGSPISGSNGTTKYVGGTGGTYSAPSSGGGGGGAGSTADGGNAGAPTAGTGSSQNGGTGGTGVSTASPSNGNPGNNYGGGGSGATRAFTGSYAGGDGAQGLMRITYATTSCAGVGKGSNWPIDASDNCWITESFNLCGANITMTGTGTIYLNATISNVNWFFIHGSGRFVIVPPGNITFTRNLDESERETCLGG